jgi:hypothetical protein
VRFAALTSAFPALSRNRANLTVTHFRPQFGDGSLLLWATPTGRQSRRHHYHRSDRE